MPTETVEVPFVTIGNRRALTGVQLVEHPSLQEFVKRFEDSFECDNYRDVLYFKEPENG